MRLFDRKINRDFVRNLAELAESKEDEKEDISNKMNPFNIEQFKNTTNVIYPNAKFDPVNVYNKVEKIEINNAENIDNSKDSVKCCVIL